MNHQELQNSIKGYSLLPSSHRFTMFGKESSIICTKTFHLIKNMKPNLFLYDILTHIDKTRTITKICFNFSFLSENYSPSPVPM